MPHPRHAAGALILLVMLTVLGIGCSSSGDTAASPTATPRAAETLTPAAAATETSTAAAAATTTPPAATPAAETPTPTSAVGEDPTATTPPAPTPAAEMPAPASTVGEDPAATPAPDPACGIELVAVFDEGAPRDRLTLENLSTADLAIASVEIDLTASAGSVIFDTRPGGTGVEVFQDFQVESGDATLAQDPVARDGSSLLGLQFDLFTAGETFTFSIDVDDQLADSDLGQIQVTGAELAGASVEYEAVGGETYRSVFNDADVARYESNC